MRGISLCKDEETENLLRKEEKTIRVTFRFISISRSRMGD